MKNIKKLLKQEAKENAPDLYADIMDAAERQGLFAREKAEAFEAVPATPTGTVGSRGKSKKPMAVIIAAALAIVAVLAILLPYFLNRSGKPSGAPSSFKPVTLSTVEFYGVGSVSAVKLLGTGGVESPALNAGKPGSDDDTVKSDIAHFNRYYTAFDSVVGNGIALTKAEDNTDAEFSEYAKKLTVSADASAGGTDYILYYNETVTDDGNKNDKQETSGVINGITIQNGIRYTVYGEHETETDGDEHEEELMLRITPEDAPSSYVEVEQEISFESGERETEYVYRLYENGKLKEETAVEFETEEKKGRTETEFELEFRDGKSKGKYKTKHNGTNGKTTVEYVVDGNKGSFTVAAVISDDGVLYKYAFPDGSEITL